jgi:hypothetical protein
MPYVCLNAAAMLGCLQAQTILTVEVYNYAGVPAGILANAEKESKRVFHDAGIELSWVPCPVSDHDLRRSLAKFDACGKTPNTPIVRIEKEVLNHLGPVAATNEGRVWVPYNRIQRVGDLYDVAPAVVLGHVIAHELGHLLLGDSSHSGDGIMVAKFREAEFRRAEMGKLLFDERQAAQMRAKLRESGIKTSARAAN